MDMLSWNATIIGPYGVIIIYKKKFSFLRNTFIYFKDQL